MLQCKIPITVLILVLITFLFLINIKPVKAQTVDSIIINDDGSISPINASIKKDGNIYTLTDNMEFGPYPASGINIRRSNIILDGANHTLHSTGFDPEFVYYGIYGSHVTNVTIKNFIIDNFKDGGIAVGSNICLISNNTVLNCHSGILVVSSNSTVIGNKIDTGNKNGAGIDILYGSYNNTIVENIIIGQAGYLIKNYGSNGVSSENRIYHNNFLLNSSISIYNPESLSSNIFDDGYPSGGNFWNDYNGTDNYHGVYQNITGSDGIGDTPYVLKLNLWNGTQYVYTTNITDRYPLAKSYSTELVVPEFSSSLILLSLMLMISFVIVCLKTKMLKR